jgi:hypothetical protein
MPIVFRLFYTFACLVPTLAFSQGNIPKGYEPLIRIVPPDTLTTLTDVYWSYNNQKYLFVKCGYDWEKPKILIVDTDNWKNFKSYPTKKGYTGFYGSIDNSNILVLERFKTFLFFFSSRKYQFLNIITGQSEFLTEKELHEYAGQHVKLDPGKSFHLTSYIYSPDKNYLVIRSSFLGNLDDLQQKKFELTVFKYSPQ